MWQVAGTPLIRFLAAQQKNGSTACFDRWWINMSQSKSRCDLLIDPYKKNSERPSRMSKLISNYIWVKPESDKQQEEDTELKGWKVTFRKCWELWWRLWCQGWLVHSGLWCGLEDVLNKSLSLRDRDTLTSVLSLQQLRFCSGPSAREPSGHFKSRTALEIL